jgi:membrane protease YdiL (CAAX protease family)
MIEPARIVWRRIAIYVGLVFLFSTPFYAIVLGLGKLGAGRGMYVMGLMWCPTLAALVTCRLTGKPVAELGWSWGRTRYQLLSVAIPLAYTAVAYVFAWVTGLAGFYNRGFVDRLQADFGWGGVPVPLVLLGFLVFQGTFGVIRSSANALGEEIGWRGFLVPELAKVTSFTGVGLVSGVIWVLYHVPILVFGDYNAGTPWWFGLTCFTVLVMGGSFLFAWMRLRSGSLWTGVLLHASHNLFIQGVFTPLSYDAGKTAYVIDEFGVALAAVVAVVAVVCWRWGVTRSFAQSPLRSP